METLHAMMFVVALMLVSLATPALTASASRADIAMGSDLVHMTLSVSQGGTAGCRSGFVFQAGRGGCVLESRDSEVQTQPCAAGSADVQTRERWRTRYAHQNGSVTHGLHTSWSDWSGACTAADPPDGHPGVPEVGSTYLVEAWVCDSTNVNYAFPAGPSDSDRDQLISTYRKFNFYQRCPERLGYRFWIEQWNQAAQDYARLHGAPMSMAYEASFLHVGSGVRKRMLDSARQRGEHLASILHSMNVECQRVADSAYGSGRITAIYDQNGNGSRCKVVQVH